MYIYSGPGWCRAHARCFPYGLSLKTCLIGLMLLMGFCGEAFAQAVPQGAQLTTHSTSHRADSASGKQSPERISDLAALDRVLTLLKDDQARAKFVGDLERLRSGRGARTDAARHREGKGKEDRGLLGAVTTAVKTAGKKVPEALAGPFDEKVDQAANEVQRRLGTGFAQGRLQRFLLMAVPGWLLALGIYFAVSALPWVRGGQARLADAIRLSTNTINVLRAISAGAAWVLLPLLCSTLIISVWPVLIDASTAWTGIFLAFAFPALAGGAIWQLASAALDLLGPSRGWRRIGYAQRRLVPWITGLGAAAVTSGMLDGSLVRDTLSAETADLAARLLDVCIGGFTIAFIIRYRLVVRSLMLRGQKMPVKPKDLSLLSRVARILAKQWHVLGLLFVLAHMMARLLGVNGDFIISAVLSSFVIVLGVLITLLLDASIAKWRKKQQQYRRGVMQHITIRYLWMVRILAHVMIGLLIGFVCLNIWGLDPEPWLQSKIGWAVVRPVLSILAVFTVGWMLWVALDSFIENRLSSVDRYGRTRAQSSRTKTLLPLVRNAIFIALCTMILLAVLVNLGINIAPLLAGAGIVGLAVGFGSQQLVQDLITGLFILFEGTIAIGDVIDTGERAGVVEALTIRTVKIRDGDGALHSIPFSGITALKNRSRDYGVYTMKVTVGYDSDLDQVMDIMREIGQELQADTKFSWDILAPLEIWGVDQFAPEGVVIMSVIKTRPLRQWSVGREFNLRLKKRFDAAGIAMAVPRLSVVASTAQDGADGKATSMLQTPTALSRV
jgi:moderate conductance mechanosensitive channel